MKRRILSLLLCGVMLLSLCRPGLALEPGQEEPPEPEAAPQTELDWAICIYMCGSDLEPRQSSATKDIVEMIMADIPKNVQVLVMTGGSKSWNPEGYPEQLVTLGYLTEGTYLTPSNEVTQLYEITDDGMKHIKNYGGNLDMGNESTARLFLQDCMTLAPAERMMVSFWNHGAGPFLGVALEPV